MRITTGKYKGRQVAAPGKIRPTEDKVRKALFDILGDIEGLSFLELYAGSGAVGFEAVSRGVSELTLVEYSGDCLRAIKANIQKLSVKECSLYPQEADRAIKQFCKDKKAFDIVFLDPPYRLGLVKKTLQTLDAYDILSPHGIVVVQHSQREVPPQELVSLESFKSASYTDTVLSFYRKRGS